MRRLLIIIPFLLTSCANLHDIEKKKADGDYIVTTSNDSFDKTYDAVKFVIRHSEDSLVRAAFNGTVIEDMKDEKLILIRMMGMGGLDMGIFFESTDDNKTKVYFVKGAFTGSAWRETRIRTIIGELDYYLNHGEAEYRKYTHEMSVKKYQSQLPEK